MLDGMAWDSMGQYGRQRGFGAGAQGPRIVRH
jgi:hypothetical protein